MQYAHAAVMHVLNDKCFSWRDNEETRQTERFHFFFTLSSTNDGGGGWQACHVTIHLSLMHVQTEYKVYKYTTNDD